MRSMKRVSIFRPPRLNSFHARVPAGNCQASGSDLSIAAPGGKAIQRRLSEPSDHSGYCGVNAVASASEKPVSSSVSGSANAPVARSSNDRNTRTTICRGCVATRARRYTRLVKNRRQESALRIAVLAEAHERHRLHHAQPLPEAPAEERVVPHRHEEAGSRERLCRRDEHGQVLRGLADGVAEEPDLGRIAGEPPFALHHGGGAGADRFEELLR